MANHRAGKEGNGWYIRRCALRIIQEALERIEGFSCEIHPSGLVVASWGGKRWKLTLTPMRRRSNA